MGASRAACTLVAGDIVAVDDQVHVIERTVALFGPPASPYVTLHFTDGLRHRVPAGWRLPVTRNDQDHAGQPRPDRDPAVHPRPIPLGGTA
ncbi:hypothetical protein [Streptomyces sp. NPDC091027]|uniref:hypothetical protein n=1 Tax=Streptomyces sp. NPDC091027 TaxID=3365971 RepID=UPI0038163F59